MSFMDNLTQMAGQLFGGANAQQASTAAGEHVAGMDPNELAGHIQQSLGSLDTGNLAALGQQLLASFTAHPPAPDGPEAAVERPAPRPKPLRAVRRTQSRRSSTMRRATRKCSRRLRPRSCNATRKRSSNSPPAC
jgi:hypothetical protein